ncbi:MAG TPA: hypothetical protein DEA43_03960 [Candidatus Moranbacteria bacterium]|nr:hypothetical protein [Candidatus Moranbacteria bacterium]HBT46009.1 hypothetical protein [Candidatus Moranbacteria bacterium]
MKIYNVLTQVVIRQLDEKSEKYSEWESCFIHIPIPFIPYLLEGRHMHLYLCDSSGKEIELPFTPEEVSWTSNGTKEGLWSMYMTMDVRTYKDECKYLIGLFKNDTRYKKIA